MRGLILEIPAPPRHQRTDLSVWISSLHAANPFYCHTALLNIHESKLEDSHLTSARGVSPLGRSDQWECLLILARMVVVSLSKSCNMLLIPGLRLNDQLF